MASTSSSFSGATLLPATVAIAIAVSHLLGGFTASEGALYFFRCVVFTVARLMQTQMRAEGGGGDNAQGISGFTPHLIP